MNYKRPFASPCAVVALFACSVVPPAFAGPPSRIHRSLEDGDTFVLTGNTHPRILGAEDQGAADSSLNLPRITFHFKMTARQQRDLDRLLQAQQERSSPSYHKWLTEEEFAKRFGVSESDLNKIVAWLQGAGFADIEVSTGRSSITMSGTAAQVQAALQTPIHRYYLDGELHYANADDPVLPTALDGIVGGIRGLSDIHPRPRAVRSSHPRFTSNVSGNIYLAPADFATIYDLQPLYSSGLDGTGQRIAIPGQTDIKVTDIQAFRSAAGLAPNDPKIVLVGKDPGTKSDDESESDLDVEWAGAVARNATIIFVNSSDVFTSVEYAIDNNVAPVLSITYGLCEAQTDTNTASTLNSEFQKANAKGITVLAASGDAGAADCDGSTDPSKPVTQAKQGLAVDFPASSPFVTALGGTQFNEGTRTYWAASNNSSGGSALSYVPEVAWNDSTAVGDLSATGGGKSTLFTKPAWQQGNGVPADGSRDIPDVALDSSGAHEGYLYCSAGWCVNGFRNGSTLLDVVGGTSAAAPTFAGIVALINQKTNSTQGNINPILYSLASISPDAFHDITAGNNQVSCQIGTPNCTTGTLGYTAGPGYDQATGLGSVDGSNLVNEWSSDFQLSVNPATLSVNAGGSNTVTVQITRFANFAGAVTLTCTVPSALTNTTCAVPNSVSGATGSATLTIKNTSTASSGLWHLSPALPSFRDSFMGLTCLMLGAGFFVLNRKRHRLFGAGVALLSLTMMSSCGGGSETVAQVFEPPSITGSVTVTGTTGVLTRSTSVVVSVP